MNIDTRIKFRHLVCFLEIARQRSFARTADALAISQPAVSKTLKELEDILQASLFERNQNGVQLTPAGLTFMRYAGPCVQALRDGVNTVRTSTAQPHTVRIGVLSTVETLLIPQVVLRLHQRHPGLVISVANGPGAYLLGQLRTGELDLVVGRMTDSPDIQGLTFEHLYSESMTLAVRPSHPLLSAPNIGTELGNYPLIVPLANTTIRQHADSLFVQCGISMPSQRLETLSVALSRHYVLASDAVWVAPMDAVRVDFHNGELAELLLPCQEPGGSVGICRNTSLTPTTAMEWFCEVLREVAHAYQASRTP